MASKKKVATIERVMLTSKGALIQLRGFVAQHTAALARMDEADEWLAKNGDCRVYVHAVLARIHQREEAREQLPVLAHRVTVAAREYLTALAADNANAGVKVDAR